MNKSPNEYITILLFLLLIILIVIWLRHSSNLSIINGGAPNSKFSSDVIDLIKKYGPDIIKLIKKYGPDAIKLIKKHGPNIAKNILQNKWKFIIISGMDGDRTHDVLSHSGS